MTPDVSMALNTSSGKFLPSALHILSAVGSQNLQSAKNFLAC